jgi:hypothetical protein
LQFRFTIPGGDASQLAPLMQAAKPFITAFGGKRVRLLQNVDDPARFVHEIDYETHELLEINRQRIASDWRVQAYLRGWRSLLGGAAVEIDVYQDVA